MSVYDCEHGAKSFFVFVFLKNKDLKQVQNEPEVAATDDKTA